MCFDLVAIYMCNSILKAGSMRSLCVVMVPVVVFCCNQWKTAAQNTSSIEMMNVTMSLNMSSVNATNVMDMNMTNMTDIVMATNNTNVSLMQSIMVSTIEVTSPYNAVTTVDVLTLTDMITSSIPVPLHLIPTSVTTVSLLSVNSISSPSFIMTITTAPVTLPVDTIGTSSIVMTSSSVTPMITTIVITTSNPLPVPSDGKSEVSSYN